MIVRPVLLSLLLFLAHEARTQCASGITAFPYTEGFESSNGGWTSGGAGNDWAWGAPAKPVITAAGGGSKCWVIGGLTGSSYTNAEASWIQSPCFDFTNLQHPYIECKVFWEMEQRFDGASLQYSTDNGATWNVVGSFNDPVNCLNENWYNYTPITYLAPLTSVKDGWSGNKQPSTGSCRGGNGSNGWVTAKHTMPTLAGQPGVLFRFIFGAGTICNNYDGFAVDDIMIGEAPPNDASFTSTCVNTNTIKFTNTSALCPTTFSWDFGDPASGTANTSNQTSPTHSFSAPGTYTVKLTVSGPDNAPSTTTKDVTVIGVTVTTLTNADCLNNTGGSLLATSQGGGPYTYSWTTSPVQTGSTATNLGAGTYTVTVNSAGACPATASGEVITDLSCIGVFFPTAFTPDGDGRNDAFGPLGSLSALTNYHLNIYNRWGEKVFSSTDPFEKWDGKVKITRTDGNVFIWYAEFNLPGQPRQLRKGFITLIR